MFFVEFNFFVCVELFVLIGGFKCKPISQSLFDTKDIDYFNCSICYCRSFQESHVWSVKICFIIDIFWGRLDFKWYT